MAFLQDGAKQQTMLTLHCEVHAQNRRTELATAMYATLCKLWLFYRCLASDRSLVTDEPDEVQAPCSTQRYELFEPVLRQANQFQRYPTDGEFCRRCSAAFCTPASVAGTADATGLQVVADESVDLPRACALGTGQAFGDRHDLGGAPRLSPEAHFPSSTVAGIYSGRGQPVDRRLQHIVLIAKYACGTSAA
jgi:hypothetical protein